MAEPEPGDLDDDMPPLVGPGGAEDPGELSDDLPPLVDQDGNEISCGPPEAAPVTPVEPVASRPAPLGAQGEPDDDRPSATGEAPGDETAVLQAAAGLRAAALRAEGAEGPISAADAVRGLMDAAEKQEKEQAAPDKVTSRMVAAISCDDFEECEDAILQGANVNADCGAGMHPIHIAAIRGELLLTELLLAHGARVNQRDLSGNTPLVYACHFFRQHGRGPQITAQLLHHRGDPLYRIKDGKFEGKSAIDLMERACLEPNMDENAPRHMRAMLQLAVDNSEESHAAITKMWMNFKSQDKKLFQVSGKKDKYDYAVKSIDWVLPSNAKNAQNAEPVMLAATDRIAIEEKFTLLTDYSFSDEGDKVKVYVSFPDDAVTALSDKAALTVDFDFQALDLKLRTGSEARYRLRIEPLFGSIEAKQCKFRASPGSKRVTLTLAKRHTNRGWSSLQKPR